MTLVARSLALASLVALGSCTFDNEPADPCGPLELGLIHDRAAGDALPPVVALSDGGEWLTVLRSCVGFGSCDGELKMQRIHVGARPEQILLTGSGERLTYRVGSVLFSLDLDDLDPDNPAPQGGPGDVGELVGSLRGGDWVLYRTEDRQLRAYYVGDEVQYDDEQQPLPRSDYAELEIEGGADLLVVALGYRHVVARKILGEGREELYLIRIAPASNTDVNGEHERGEAHLLAAGDRFTRVLLTAGPSDEPSSAFLHDLPRDVDIIVTAGGRVGSKAASAPSTRIYQVSDRSLVDVIDGADVRTSMLAFEDISGLQPVSPDGSHLAFLTERGSLALHDLESRRSCMLRPADSGSQHVLAGFGADGTLYFESVADNGRDQVYAYDPASQTITPLTHDDNFWRLFAVPPEPFVDEQGARHPWAVVANDGVFAAQAAIAPTPLDYADVSFMPRGGEGLWLLEGREGTPNLLSLRRIQPELGEADRLHFDTDSADPTVEVDVDTRRLAGDATPSNTEEPPLTAVVERFTMIYDRSDAVCLSASQATAGATPWSGRCSSDERQTLYLDNGLPEAEAK